MARAVGDGVGRLNLNPQPDYSIWPHAHRPIRTNATPPLTPSPQSTLIAVQPMNSPFSITTEHNARVMSPETQFPKYPALSALLIKN